MTVVVQVIVIFSPSDTFHSFTLNDNKVKLEPSRFLPPIHKKSDYTWRLQGNHATETKQELCSRWNMKLCETLSQTVL